MALPKTFKKTIIRKKTPLVSIIIPVYNEERDIVACLESIKDQTYKKVETIIIDDGSKDKTLEVVKSFGGIRVYKQDHQGPGQARNLGAKMAKGEILLFIDADMILFSDYVVKIISPIIKNKTLGAIESIQYNFHKTKIQECWGDVVRVKHLKGINSETVRAIAKKDFLGLGGFDKKYGYADDQTFFLKYGLKFLIVEDVKCYHKTPQDFKGVFKQSKWIGASLEAGYMKHRSVRLISPLALLIISPISLVILTIKKLIEVKKAKLIPWMFIFMIARYFGTIYGIFSREYLKNNTR